MPPKMGYSTVPHKKHHNSGHVNFNSADYGSPCSPSKGLSGASGKRSELSNTNAAAGTRWADAPVHKVNPKR